MSIKDKIRKNREILRDSLYTALRLKDTDKVRFLIEERGICPDNETSMNIVAENGDKDLFRYLVNRGAYPTINLYNNHRNFYNNIIKEYRQGFYYGISRIYMPEFKIEISEDNLKGMFPDLEELDGSTDKVYPICLIDNNVVIYVSDGLKVFVDKEGGYICSRKSKR